MILKDDASACGEVVGEKGVELIDLCALYEAHAAQDGQSMDDFLLDGIHPNGRGHRRAADILVERILSMVKG